MPEASKVKTLISPVSLEQDKHRVVSHFFSDPEGQGLSISIQGAEAINLAPGAIYSPVFGIMSPMDITGDGWCVVS